MIAEISAGLSSLNTAKQIVQGLNALKSEISVNEAKINLQGLILEAQQGLFAAQQVEAENAKRIANLEHEIVKLKDWSTEAERYELKAIDSGAFAYMLKPGMERGEPPHWLCTNCFEKRQKSIVQFRGQQIDRNGSRGSHSNWGCNSCKAELVLVYTRKPSMPYQPKES